LPIFTPSRVEQNRRRRSTSSWVSGTVSRWNSFFRAMADPVKRLAGVSVDGVVVAHDDAHCGSLVRGRKLDLVDQGPNERNAQAPLELESLGVGDGRMLGQVGDVEAAAAILDA